MKLLKHFNARNWQMVLNTFIAAGIFIMLLMFINFNAQAAENAKIARETSESTNAIVRSQQDILDAIKRLAIDNNETAEKKTNIIICMLQVPVAQRTTDTVTMCRKQVDSGTTVVIKESPAPQKSQGSTQSQQNSQSKSILKTVNDNIVNLLKRVQL